MTIKRGYQPESYVYDGRVMSAKLTTNKCSTNDLRL